MRRREFLALTCGGAFTWPLSAHAQSAGVPVVGMLNGQSAATFSHLAAAFRKGLQDNGFVDGQNVLIEYRWAEGHDERLPAMAVDLVNRQVAVLFSGGSIWSTITAKAATSTIPIVFVTGDDPIKLGYVPSLNRPGGNVTGVSFLVTHLVAKRVELASNLVPSGATIGFLGRPSEPRYAAEKKESEAAAAALGLQLLYFNVVSERDFEAAISAAARQRVGALVVNSDPFFNSHRDHIIALAARYAVPAVYELREFVTAGGLISYGTSIGGAYRQAGAYVGRILKGAKPGDLPVVQSDRFELVVNLKTAKALGLAIPQSVLVAADEVIE